MKNLCTLGVCLCMLLATNFASAQQQNAIPINQPDLNRPRLFQSLPDRIPVRIESLTSLLSLTPGRNVTVGLSDAVQFIFQGEVVSAASKYDNAIQSVVVRSSNYPGAALTFSRVKDENGETTFTGRIISMQHADLYELKHINNEFVLVKNKFYSVVNQ